MEFLNNEMVQKLLVEIILLIVAIGGTFAVKLIKEQIGVKGMEKIEQELVNKQEIAAIAVKFIEQAYTEYDGEEKFNKAFEYIADRCEELGIKVEPEEIEALIESAVRTFKDTFGESWAEAIENDKHGPEVTK